MIFHHFGGDQRWESIDSLMTCCPQGRWYMLIEEVGQVYQSVAPIPLWFRYLITYQEVDGNTGLTLGVLLALVYFILKVADLQLHHISWIKNGCFKMAHLAEEILCYLHLLFKCTKLFFNSAFRIVWTVGVFPENCEAISQWRGTVL